MRYRGILGVLGIVTVFMTVLFLVPTVAAAEPDGDFSLQVTPSPMMATLKPGTTTELELKVRNTGTQTEELKIELQGFKVDNKTGQVSLDDTTKPEVLGWTSYSAPRFTVQPGQWYSQKIRVALPKDSGFSYSFASVISRIADPLASAGRVMKGSLAVFTLINVDRPGAVRKLDIEKFAPTLGVYEYLPATFDIQLKNTGNTITQPYGNIFIQRDGDAKPIAVLPINDKKGSILPGSSRTLQALWGNGFPAYNTTTTAAGQQTNEIWDWSKISEFRAGRYTAKLVAVYNDGQRDVPIEREVTFWVIPWKIALGTTIILVILGFGVWTILRKIWTTTHRGKHRKVKLS